VTFAAVEAFDTIETCALVEPHAAFRDLATELLAESSEPVLKHATVHAGDARRFPAGLAKADLVVASYVLVETDAAGTRDIIATALAHCTEAILFVEPGTPAGFEKIRDARGALIAAGLRVVAPCPGNVACPMTAPDWCHFSQRLPRSRDHMALKAASVPFEDERYAYVAATRTTPPGTAIARILAEPGITKAAIELKLCAPMGLVHRRVPRSDKAGYKAARKYSWGDTVPPPTIEGAEDGNDP
jgi:ribosomal protein RSM22 (predicted rRNA methylase)